MASTNTMVKRCAGLVGTRDITDWEEKFLTSVVERSANGDHPERLSPGQVESLERIHDKHFEG